VKLTAHRHVVPVTVMTELSPLPVSSRRVEKLTTEADLTCVLKVTGSDLETDCGILEGVLRVSLERGKRIVRLRWFTVQSNHIQWDCTTVCNLSGCKGAFELCRNIGKLQYKDIWTHQPHTELPGMELRFLAQ
jgi:hypothetical protein